MVDPGERDRTIVGKSAMLRGKKSPEVFNLVPVPQTDTGR
jgi:hypothetical protein